MSIVLLSVPLLGLLPLCIGRWFLSLASFSLTFGGGFIADELANCVRFHCSFGTWILFVTTKWPILHKLHYFCYCIYVWNQLNTILYLHIVFSMTMIKNLVTFRDPLNLRGAAVGVPLRTSCWCLHSSAVLQSQQSCSFVTHYDHVLGCGARDKTRCARIFPCLAHIISIWISVRSLLAIYCFTHFSYWFFYTIVLANIYSSYGCLLFISPVVLLNFWYLSCTCLSVLQVPTQHLLTLTFISITRTGPVSVIHVYPAFFTITHSVIAVEYSFKLDYSPLLALLHFINILPDESLGLKSA